jgi:hypothetical protein
VAMTDEEIREFREFLYQRAPEERLVYAIHRMAMRYADSLENHRYQRGYWQLAAITRLSRSLHRYGQQHP